MFDFARRSPRGRRFAVGAAALCLLAAPPARALDTLWDASTGVLPDAMPCPWVKVTNTTPAPAFAGGALVLSTSNVAGNTFYEQTQSQLAIPVDSLVVEARVQYVSGTTSSSTRAPVAVEIEHSAFRGTVFFVGAGEIFFNSGPSTRGGTLTTPTADAPHLYRIVIAGTALHVYRDGVLALNGATYFDNVNGSFAGFPRILWGEASSLAFGTSNWFSFRHNAAPGTNCGVVATRGATWGRLKTLYR